MAVLSKPVDLAFEVKKEQTKRFLENSKVSMLDKALTRASMHKVKKVKKED